MIGRRQPRSSKSNYPRCKNPVLHRPVELAQYTALRYSDRLAEVGAVASIGTVGDPYDNALAETVVGLYKNECVKIDGPFRGADDLELATLSWVHWFNENRLHSSIDYVTPIEKENQYYREINARQQPLPGQLALH
ncbi:hypothetical protein DEI86_09870 [Curtobacterium sp. MCBD17_028]|nr:hypothetical protein DEI86_09870 [Curtobacterium sp. MCBD17_028]